MIQMITQPKRADSHNPGAARAQLLDLTGHNPEKALDALIEHAVNLSASDLFLATNEQHVAAQVRAMGLMRVIGILPLELGRKVMSTLKAQAGMDLNERRRPLDGRWIHEMADRSVDLRINMIPTLHGEDFAIRILDRGGSLMSLEHLGMFPDQLDALSGMLQSPGGMILLCGPTGAGKTATMYACLGQLHDGNRKINTIEDPIEFSIDGLRQSQVNPAIGLTFSELLRSVMRQSPDVIMVGEIRDEQTAKTAVHAANSGQMVFATIHAPSAAHAVQSMQHLGANTHFLSTALKGVISQRLVRTLCPKCKSSFDLADAPETFAEVRPWLVANEGKTLFAPKGCEECGNEGYAGRTGVFEVLTVTRAIRQLISDAQPVTALRDQMVAEKMPSFRQAALLKVARGLTSSEEVFRVIPAEHLEE
jgi:type II secretory ATPase GspE/PulE/Tfp pilus assembly ATPase PilB-like protein